MTTYIFFILFFCTLGAMCDNVTTYYTLEYSTTNCCRGSRLCMEVPQAELENLFGAGYNDFLVDVQNSNEIPAWHINHLIEVGRKNTRNDRERSSENSSTDDTSGHHCGEVSHMGEIPFPEYFQHVELLIQICGQYRCWLKFFPIELLKKKVNKRVSNGGFSETGIPIDLPVWKEGAVRICCECIV